MKYFIMLLLLISSNVLANDNESWLDSIQYHGFASQGLIFTTDNNFFGDSDHGSAELTELGINASIQLSPKIRVAGQVISRYAGEFYNGSPWLDYALVDIKLLSTSPHLNINSARILAE